MSHNHQLGQIPAGSSTHHVTSHKYRRCSVDEHRQFLLLGLRLVGRVPGGVNKDVGGVLANPNGVESMRYFWNSKLVRRLLGVPLRA